MGATPAEAPQVLVVEDDPEAARRIRELLVGDGSFACLGPCPDVAGALRLARQHRPAIILYDLHQQGHWRPEGIAALKELLPDARVLVLTNYEDTESVFQALRHGADGYVLKSDQRLPIVHALRHALEDDPPLTRTVARRILRHFQQAPPKPGGPVPTLSPRQREVVGLVCEGWTNKEIAARLQISTDAVKQHVAAVKRKLEVRSRTQIPGRLGQA